MITESCHFLVNWLVCLRPFYWALWAADNWLICRIHSHGEHARKIVDFESEVIIDKHFDIWLGSRLLWSIKCSSKPEVKSVTLRLNHWQNLCERGLLPFLAFSKEIIKIQHGWAQKGPGKNNLNLIKASGWDLHYDFSRSPLLFARKVNVVTELA